MEWFNVSLTLLYMTLTLTAGSVLQFSLGDVYGELQSWGTVVLGRYNGSGLQDLPWSRVGVSVTQLTLLDSAHTTLASYTPTGSYQEYNISPWEGAKYATLGASGRRMTSHDLGKSSDLQGQIDLFLYVFTEAGKLPGISHDFHQRVDTGDALLLVNLHNVTHCANCNLAYVELRIHVKGPSESSAEVTLDSKDNIQSDVVHIPSSAFIMVSNKVGNFSLYYSYKIMKIHIVLYVTDNTRWRTYRLNTRVP